MSNTHEIYLVSDSTGETLDRIFLAIKAQFDKIQYKTHQFDIRKTSPKQSEYLDKSWNHSKCFNVCLTFLKSADYARG